MDSLAIRSKLEDCRVAGVPRELVVSSLCSDRFWHPLVLYWLMLTCIPRRLVFQVYLEDLEASTSIDRGIEITSGDGLPLQDQDRWLTTPA